MEDITKSVEDLATEVKGVAASLEKVAALPEDVAAAKAELEELKVSNKATADQLEVQIKDLAEYKAQLKASYGKSGADDWRNDFSNFIKAAWHKGKGIPMPDWIDKAAVAMVTDVDAAGGYLVPTAVAAEVTKLTLRHGAVWPLVNKVTVPAGQYIDYPWESTLASAAFRAGTSSGVQNVAVGEMDPGAVWGNDQLRPNWLNCWVTIANEAMTAPGIKIADSLAVQMSSQLVRRIEYAILRGTVGTATAHTGRTSPSNGILMETNINSQTAAATVTLALIDAFIAESLADNEGLGDTGEVYIATTDGAAHALKTGLTQQGIDWGNVAAGTFPSLRGYKFVTSPYVNRVRSTSEHDYIMMAPFGKITVAWTGSFAIGFNESIAWKSNSTLMMASTHADFALGNPDMYSYTSFTALA